MLAGRSSFINGRFFMTDLNRVRGDMIWAERDNRIPHPGLFKIPRRLIKDIKVKVKKNLPNCA